MTTENAVKGAERWLNRLKRKLGTQAPWLNPMAKHRPQAPPRVNLSTETETTRKCGHLCNENVQLYPKGKAEE